MEKERYPMASEAEAEYMMITKMMEDYCNREYHIEDEQLDLEFIR